MFQIIIQIRFQVELLWTARARVDYLLISKKIGQLKLNIKSLLVKSGWNLLDSVAIKPSNDVLSKNEVWPWSQRYGSPQKFLFSVLMNGNIKKIHQNGLMMNILHGLPTIKSHGLPIAWGTVRLVACSFADGSAKFASACLTLVAATAVLAARELEKQLTVGGAAQRLLDSMFWDSKFCLKCWWFIDVYDILSLKK